MPFVVFWSRCILASFVFRSKPTFCFLSLFFPPQFASYLGFSSPTLFYIHAPLNSFLFLLLSLNPSPSPRPSPPVLTCFCSSVFCRMISFRTLQVHSISTPMHTHKSNCLQYIKICLTQTFLFIYDPGTPSFLFSNWIFPSLFTSCFLNFYLLSRLSSDFSSAWLSPPLSGGHFSILTRPHHRLKKPSHPLQRSLAFACSSYSLAFSFFLFFMYTPTLKGSVCCLNVHSPFASCISILHAPSTLAASFDSCHCTLYPPILPFIFLCLCLGTYLRTFCPHSSGFLSF